MPRSARLAAGLAAFTSLALSEARAGTAQFQYVIEAANEMARTEYSKAFLSPAENAGIARTACGAMTKLVDDEHYQAALVSLLSPDHLGPLAGKADGLINNLAEFNMTFLRIEEETLKEAGLEYPVVFDALRIASVARTHVYLGGSLSVEVVTQDVKYVKDTICELATGNVADPQRAAINRMMGAITLEVADVMGAREASERPGTQADTVRSVTLVTSIGIATDAASYAAEEINRLPRP